MKILKKNISAKDGSGSIMLRPETPEDLWHSYNLLQKGDMVRCTTVRKVVKESNTGSTTSSKKRLNLTIQLKKVDFDPDALEVRLSGTVQSENELVRMGAHHTLTLELNQNFSIEKECWDAIYLDLIEEAVNPDRQAEVAAVVMHMGLAHVCLVTGALTITKVRIDINIPKKRTGSSANAKAVTKFFEAVYQAILRHVDFQKVKVVLIGSPGFVKDDFFQYIVQEAVRRDDRTIIENKSKFVLVRASNGHKYALEEVFSDPNIMQRMNDTKVAKEVEVLHKFMRMMDVDPDRAYYGFAHVQRAQEQQAVDSLLVTDELFRSSSVKTRRQYVDLVEDVRASGGKVYIFSSMHISGQQLQQVSGVAAILRYPLPDLDELEELAEQDRTDVTDDEGSEEGDEETDQVREDLEYMNF
ncbi:cell division protein pelota PelA [Nitzschia inconspicua]|uniref:Protein pelota homolog n=1 Tax=Nitzschia inconspicua TaxID=303405 RepID=A0A9K3L2S3_9STRA|nr:cell division protein pelota PelA [Nitzschia inconspicua]